MGYQAATMLFRAIEKGEGSVLYTVKIRVRLVTREPVGPPPQIK